VPKAAGGHVSAQGKVDDAQGRVDEIVVGPDMKFNGIPDQLEEPTMKTTTTLPVISQLPVISELPVICPSAVSTAAINVQHGQLHKYVAPGMNFNGIPDQRLAGVVRSGVVPTAAINFHHGNPFQKNFGPHMNVHGIAGQLQQTAGVICPGAMPIAMMNVCHGNRVHKYVGPNMNLNGIPGQLQQPAGGICPGSVVPACPSPADLLSAGRVVNERHISREELIGGARLTSLSPPVTCLAGLIIPGAVPMAAANILHENHVDHVIGPDMNLNGISDQLEQPAGVVVGDAPPMPTALILSAGQDYVVTGEDRNNDGIPDVLQGGPAGIIVGDAPPIATALIHNAGQDYVVTGEDRNHKGIPDVLQGGAENMFSEVQIRPTAINMVDVDGDVCKDYMHVGADLNCDGIVDDLQQPTMLGIVH